MDYSLPVILSAIIFTRHINAFVPHNSFHRPQYGRCDKFTFYQPNPESAMRNSNIIRYYKALEDEEDDETKPKLITKHNIVFNQTKPKLTKHDLQWNERLDELRSFHSQHGHCQVPYNYKSNPKLSRWVTNQRQSYKSYKQNKKSSMTPTRIEALEELEFVWDAHARRSSWRDRFRELKMYKEMHRDCLVPYEYVENPQLGKWVSHQRREYKLLRQGKKSSMTEKRIAALVSVGLEFESNTNQKSWNKRFQELQDYKKVHGNCLVPMQHPSNPQLGRWVDTQRTAYRLLRKGKNSPLTKERVEKLNELGFTWDPQETTWAEQFSQLRQYVKNNGHCNVSQESYPNLYNWIQTQKTQYKLLQEGKNSSMTEERIEALDTLSFPWNTKKTTPWTKRYQQLKQYRLQHGDCLVPQKYPKLGSWVKAQRRQYKLLEEGKQSSMTEERIEMLEKIGFVWNVVNSTGAQEGEEEEREGKMEEDDFDVSALKNKSSKERLMAWRNRFKKFR